MVTSIPQIIAAVNPDLYYEYGSDKKKLEKFKALIKEKGILEAAKEAVPTSLKLDEKGKIDAINGIKTEYKLTYDSPTETLEPIYFFILDLMNDMGLKAEKLIDNFVSSPGSGHFGEMGQRASVMQQQGSKLLGDINTIIRSVINLIYDLREYKIRLEPYTDLNSKDKDKSEAALLSLKQVWMDKVDAQKQNASIKAMAFGQAGFVTLIDAFLIAKDEAAADKLDLNDSVKRIVKGRIAEFNHWLKYSEDELKKRYEIEKTYLKSQVNSLKLYSRWAKPYLKAAEQLGMASRERHPALVKMFNTILLELTLIGKNKVSGEFPASLKSYVPKREFYQVVLVSFEFRGMPQRTEKGYVAGGRAEITFSGYLLTNEEIKKFYEAFDKSDISDAFDLVEGITKDSLDNLSKDLDEFMNEKEIKKDEKKDEKKKSSDFSNPFLALFGFYNEKAPKQEGKKETEIKLSDKDKRMEKEYILPIVAPKVKETTFNLFEIYKKAHGMPSF